MAFNFGETPFKYPPSGGFIGISKASDQCTVAGQRAASAAKQGKPRKNAPQAIILEVRSWTGVWYEYVLCEGNDNSGMLRGT